MIKPTNSGERRIRIEIQKCVEGKDAFGTPTKTWVPLAKAWAAKLSHSGRKFFQAQQMRNEVTEVFNIRYLTGITTEMRVITEGRTYEILDADDREGRHREVDLHCKAVS